MYRDDHDALLARAESLERSLADNKEALEDKSERLDETSAELKAREKELASVRRRLAKLERPSGGSKAPQLAVLSLGVLIAGGAASWAILNASQPEPPAKAELAVTRVAEQAPPKSRELPPLPETISASVINAAFDRAMPAIQACAKKHQCTGVLHLAGRITLIGSWQPVPTGTQVRVNVKTTTKVNGKVVESQVRTDSNNRDLVCPSDEARMLATDCVWSTLAAKPLGSSRRGGSFTRDIAIATE